MIPTFVLSLAPKDMRGGVAADAIARLQDGAARSQTASGAGYRLSAHPALPLLAIGVHGHLVGTIFARGSNTRVTNFTAAEAEAIRASDGRWLIDRCWGGWLAVLAAADGRSAAVLRDASPALPIFHVAAGGFDHYTNDARALVAAGLATADPDPDYARQALAWPDLRTARTGLSDVDEVLPGQRQRRLGSTLTLANLWSPWDHAGIDRAISDRKAAVDLIRAETLGCVAAWARCCAMPLLELSGGLDSSIIAAALYHAGIVAEAITFATASPDGDERRFARSVAECTGLTLREVTEQPHGLALSTRRARTLRPGTHPALVGIDAVLEAGADRIGADAFLSSTGGDNVFCYINTASPVLDLLRTPGRKPSVRSTVSDLARLHETTVWHAGRSAWRRARRQPAPLWRPSVDMITREAAALPIELHRWLDAPSDALPGKTDHVKALLRIQAVLDTNDRGRTRPMHYPLLSQPLVEACLRVPTWMWIEGGRDRAIARAAFADLLPEAVLARRTKGRLETQSLHLYLANRTAIRDLLMTGWLAEHRIADRTTVERYTASADPPRDDRYFRLFELVGMELWARAWRD